MEVKYVTVIAIYRAAVPDDVSMDELNDKVDEYFEYHNTDFRINVNTESEDSDMSEPYFEQQKTYTTQAYSLTVG